MSNEFKVGDRVKFLNAIGGGVVRKVLRSSGVVYVEDETGFEIPLLPNELLKVEPDGPMAGPKVEEAPKPPPIRVAPAPKRSSDPSGERLNVALCYLPEEGGEVGRCCYEVYLVNDSNYDLWVTYASGRGAAQELRYAGKVPFDSSEMLESFGADQLAERGRTTIQLLAYKEEGVPYRPKPAMSIELKVDGARFFKQHAFVETPYFDDPAITFQLVKDDQPLLTKRVDVEALAAEMVGQKVRADRRVVGHMTPRREKDAPLVVDLHIDELVDTTLGLTPKDMLDIQLRKVEEVMRAHRKPACVGQKIIFIHGKGEGVLRKAVWDLMKKKFARHDLQDASFQEYGFGATQVTIR